jgi:hypothetical protein
LRTRNARRTRKGLRTRDFEPKDDGKCAREQNPDERHGDDADADGKTATESRTLENEVEDATTHGVFAVFEEVVYGLSL